METQIADPPESVPARTSDDALRLADGVLVALRDGQIILENAVTKRSKAFSKDSIPIIDLFMDWTEPGDIISWALSQDGDAAKMNQAVGVLCDLLELDVLIPRREDLTGARLPPPGGGWTTAMRFLLATRTTKATIFAPPAEFNAALAEKAALTRQASGFMEYVDVPFRELPEPRTEASGDDLSFPDVMLQRRTARRFAPEPVTEAELSTLLKLGWGMVKSVPNPLGDVFVRKTSPSGGSLHPIEVYPMILNVEGVEKGIYHYSVRRHGLEQIWSGDAREWISTACGDQDWVAEAGVAFLCTAFLPRTAWKYDYSRVARAVMAEIGLTGQSVLLTASWLGLGAFTTIALRDEFFEELIGLDPLREPVFAVFGMGRLETDITDHSRPRAEFHGEVEGQ